MDFLNPAFLWGLPLVGLPVLVHLMNRRRQDVIRWGAMQFLLEAVPRRRRRWHLEDMLLMLLRMALVLLVILALARPRVTTSLAQPDGPREVVLVIDDSLSAGRMDRSGSVFDRELEAVGKILGELESKDTLRVVRACDPADWPIADPLSMSAEGKQRATETLRALKPTLGQTDMVAAIRAALNAEAAEPPGQRIVAVVTDGQVHGWRADALGDWRALQESIKSMSGGAALGVVTAGVEGLVQRNCAVEGLSAARTVVGVGEPVTLTATVRNRGQEAVPAGLVKLLADGQEVGSAATLPLGPDEATQVELFHALPSAGVHTFAAELARTDDLPLDNRDVLVVEAVEHIPVLIVDGSPGTPRFEGDVGWLLAAMGRRPAGEEGQRGVFDPTVVPAFDLSPEMMDNYPAIVLANTSLVRPDLLQALAERVRQGTGVWILLGEHVDRNYFNKNLCAEPAPFSPLTLGEPRGDAGQRETFEQLQPPTLNHPATRLLADLNRLDTDKVQLFRRHVFAPAANARPVSVLLASGDGAPLAIDRTLGHGRVIVQGMPMNVTWSNLPICQSFVVLVHEWLWYLVEPSQPRRNLNPGEVYAASLPGDPAAAMLKVLTPTGSERMPHTIMGQGHAGVEFSQTSLPGEYRLTVASGKDETTLPFTVRRNIEESDLTPMTESDRRLLSQNAGVRFDGDVLAAPEATAAVPPEPAWAWLLMAALLMGAGELLLSGRLNRRRAGIASEPATEISFAGA